MKNKPLKVLVLSHISELVGGAERSILEVLEAWEDKYKIEPVFILRSPVGSLGPAVQKRKWNFHSLQYTFWSESSPPDTSERMFRAAYQNSKAITEIEKLIQDINPDFVLTNSVVCPWAAIAAYYQRVPHVWFIREYGDLDHGRVFEIGQEKTFRDVGFLSQLVITNSETLNKHVSQYISKNKVTTLYHPFDINKLVKATNKKVANPFIYKDSLKLVLTGSIAESKGHKEIIEAIGKLSEQGDKNIELCVVGSSGDPKFMDELLVTIKHYDIRSRVHLVGYQKNPMPYIKYADIGIMSSRMEAFGRVTFEYMALGKPVIGVNGGATPELIDDGQSGYLFEYRNTEQLMSRIKNYVNNPELIKKHGQKSYNKAKKMMSGKHSVDKVYDEVSKAVDVRLEDLPEVFHYSHEWLHYTSLAKDFIDELGVVSVKRLFVKRFVNKLREYNDSIKALYRRLFR